MISLSQTEVILVAANTLLKAELYDARLPIRAVYTGQEHFYKISI